MIRHCCCAMSVRKTCMPSTGKHHDAEAESSRPKRSGLRPFGCCWRAGAATHTQLNLPSSAFDSCHQLFDLGLQVGGKGQEWQAAWASVIAGQGRGVLDTRNSYLAYYTL